MPTRRCAPTERENIPAFSHPDDDMAWQGRSNAEILQSAHGRLRVGINIVDMLEVGALPPLEVPPCLTLQQWLDIMNNGA